MKLQYLIFIKKGKNSNKNIYQNNNAVFAIIKLLNCPF